MCASQLHDLCMALKSGLPECVPWALNAIALASFDSRPELQLPSLPGLLPALLEVSASHQIKSWSHLSTLVFTNIIPMQNDA